MSLEAEAEAFRFLRTNYNANKVRFLDEDTRVECAGLDWCCVFTTRVIGREHRLILKVLHDYGETYLCLTTCSPQSVSNDSRHSDTYCARQTCGGRCLPIDDYASFASKKGATISVLRVSDTEVAVSVSDPPSDRKFVVDADSQILAGVVVSLCTESQKIIPDDDFVSRMEKQKQEKQMKEGIRMDGSLAEKINHHVNDIIEFKSFVTQKNEEQATLLRAVEDKVTKMEETQSSECVREKESLTDRIRDQEKEISELRQQMAQMKVGSAADSDSNADFSAWLSNSFVLIRDSLMKRVGQINERNYIFCSSCFGVDSRITFVVREVNPAFAESLTFGVTVFAPHVLNMHSLPTFGQTLQQKKKDSKNWFIASDFLSNPEAGLVVCLERTESGILMKTEKEERMLLTVDDNLTVFPFFLFDSAVQAIELKDFEVRDAKKRKGIECAVCGENRGTAVIQECGHALFCWECRAGVAVGNKDADFCPVCCTYIKKLKDILIT